MGSVFADFLFQTVGRPDGLYWCPFLFLLVVAWKCFNVEESIYVPPSKLLGFVLYYLFAGYGSVYLAWSSMAESSGEFSAQVSTVIC